MLEWIFHGNLCRTIGPLTLHSQEIGVAEVPGEDPRRIAEALLRDGLRLPHLTNSIVRAFRMPFNTKNGKPGHIKIELMSEEDKKQVLSVTGRLKGYTAMGRKVIVRSSQPHDMRIMVGNMHTLVNASKLNNELMVAANGSIRPLNRSQYQQQFQMGQQTVQQWGQSADPQMVQQQMSQPMQPHVVQTQPQMTNQFSYTVPPPTFQPQVAQQSTAQTQVQQTRQAQSVPYTHNRMPPTVSSLLPVPPATQNQQQTQTQQMGPAPNYAPLSYASAAQAYNRLPATVSSQMSAPTVPTPTQSLSQCLQTLAQDTVV